MWNIWGEGVVEVGLVVAQVLLSKGVFTLRSFTTGESRLLSGNEKAGSKI